VAIEKLTNPFLRASESEIKQELDMIGHSDESVFAEIRRRKDSF
jgi:hydroxyacylglutathione hydrolase